MNVSLLTGLVSADGPPRPENIHLTGTSFLDHDSPISSFWGQTFLRENIPFIDIPDAGIQDVYYYRWSALQRHLRYTIAGTGYILTEFIQPVDYAQAFNTIDAAAGHHIDEARWLRSHFYGDDYIQVFARGPGNTIQYTHWILDSLVRRSKVVGDTQFTAGLLADMIRMWHEWDFTFDSTAGLYYFTPHSDAQEFSLPGYVADPYGDKNLQFGGPDTYRPSHNAYMIANAQAIADVATMAGDVLVASKFNQIASNLNLAMITHLWDPIQQFFVDVIRPNNPNLSYITGREEVGLFPFRFGIGLDPTYSNPAVQQLFDPKGFLTMYGPTTLEVRNQYYKAIRPSDHCCYWNGQSWPYSTSHVLKSLAAIYRTGNSSVTADQYVQYLQIYAATQQKNGAPYVAESHYPEMDAWSADASNHSEHYAHSTNNDDVITGLLGIIPRSDENFEVSPIIPQNWTYFAIENLAYHGHLVTVLYDASGTRYNNGSGLSIYVDGTKVYNGPKTSAIVPLPTIQVLSPSIPINIATNPNGLGAYPLANATYTYRQDNPYKAIDGYLFYDKNPDNRWTNYASPNENDTLRITFARPRNISSVTAAIFSDVARYGAIDVPASIEIYGSAGLLARVNSSLVANDRNTFSFPEVETEFIALNMFNKPNLFVGVCEVEVWTSPIFGPIYYAVDTMLVGANVKFDTASTATCNGAVVGDLSPGSSVAFSGIDSTGGTVQLSLSYANFANSSVSIQVTVNQVSQGRITLPATGGKYQSATTEVQLAAGKNFVYLIGGSADISYEVLTVSDDRTPASVAQAILS
jgi:hypothetical protein